MKSAAYRQPDAPFLQELQRRRSALLSELRKNDALCLVRAYENHPEPRYPRALAKQEAHYEYLVGLEEWGGIAVFAPGAAQEKLLFLPARSAFTELWSGPMTEPKEAAAAWGFDACFEISEFPSQFAELCKQYKALYAQKEGYLAAPEAVKAALQQARMGSRGVEWRDTTVLLGDLRVVKSPWEQQQLRKAGQVGSHMHQQAMLFAKPGISEQQVQAHLEYQARLMGSVRMGYSSIVASGENCCSLHYTVNSCVAEGGELMLIDAGCEWNGFTSDITRTFPVSGKFVPEQKDLYEVVLEAQNNAIQAVKPGVSLKDLEEIASEVLIEGLFSLRLLKGDKALARQEKKLKDFYPHRLSHWLGIDVHDSGTYWQTGGDDRPLQPGMCFTVEPGLYLQTYADVADPWKGLGVRIEDNILVTESGYENLTTAVKSVSGIEELCQRRNAP
jgi:Xaa-Pro aminopeptidase